MNAWNNFNSGDWQNEINVRDFIQKNYGWLNCLIDIFVDRSSIGSMKSKK